MPIYEFDCRACGHVFERLQKLSDADPTVCPACGKETVKRALSAPSFRLSGSGWYETDFKGDKDKKRNLAGSDDTGKPAVSDPGKPADAAKPAPAPAATPTPTATSSPD